MTLKELAERMRLDLEYETDRARLDATLKECSGYSGPRDGCRNDYGPSYCHRHDWMYRAEQNMMPRKHLSYREIYDVLKAHLSKEPSNG